MNPASLEEDSPVPGAPQQIITERILDGREDVHFAGRMQAMAAIVATNTLESEAAGVASNSALPFQRQHFSLAGGGKPEGGTDPRGPCAKHDDSGFAANRIGSHPSVGRGNRSYGERSMTEGGTAGPAVGATVGF